jgi:hypothetical protein
LQTVTVSLAIEKLREILTDEQLLILAQQCAIGVQEQPAGYFRVEIEFQRGKPRRIRRDVVIELPAP